MHENSKHHRILEDEYVGPSNTDNVVNQLDIVILGATEIDLDFNVNVTTGADGTVLDIIKMVKNE